MRTSDTFVLLMMAAALGLPTSAHAITTLDLELGSATIVGNQAQMAVTINFSDTDSNTTGLTYFQLDVSQSDSALTAGGTDFSRFSFTPASPLLDNWGPVPILDFPSGPQYALGVDTTLFPNDGLSSGVAHVVGTLNILLENLVVGDYLVDIEYTDLSSFDGTLGFFQQLINPQLPSQGFDPQSEDIVNQVTFSNGGSSDFTVVNNAPAIPEPATFALGIIGIASLATRRMRNRV